MELTWHIVSNGRTLLVTAIWSGRVALQLVIFLNVGFAGVSPETMPVQTVSLSCCKDPKDDGHVHPSPCYENGR